MKPSKTYGHYNHTTHLNHLKSLTQLTNLEAPPLCCVRTESPE